MLNNGPGLRKKTNKGTESGKRGEKAIRENMYIPLPLMLLFCSQHIRMNKHQVLTQLTPSFLPRPSETERVLT